MDESSKNDESVELSQGGKGEEEIRANAEREQMEPEHAM
jgi:hypothetical protein